MVTISAGDHDTGVDAFKVPIPVMNPIVEHERELLGTFIYGDLESEEML